MAVRLDKFLSDTGVGTRTEVKKIIKSGQVTVNGRTAQKPEEKIDEQNDRVFCCGRELRYVPFTYYIFHKPAGCVTAVSDAVHKTVMDYFPQSKREGLFPVGRLDLDTEGLLLITNDGQLAHELLSPNRHIPKTYYAKISGKVTDSDVNLFAEGVDIGEKRLTAPALLKILQSDNESEIELTITEGKFHQVKRMFQAIGTEVVYLKRISMGSLLLEESLLPGEYRALTGEELFRLRRQTGRSMEEKV